MARIRFANIVKRFGPVVAVERLNLDIRDKSFVVLLGPSGCGKTTILNMVAGLEDPTEGEISFDGEVVNFMPPHKRDVAMVFQSYALYPHKNVYENIAFGLRMRGYAQQGIDRRVRDAADALGITHAARPAPASAKRRPAAAGRARTCHGAAARRVLDGRAAEQSRCRAPSYHAGGTERAASARCKQPSST